jgi:catechol 2,3-dioxygenase-like lactoylglutathione lyase family enzyme
MIQFVRFDHLLVSIPLGATEAARGFYRDLLGLFELPGPHPGGALWFQVGNVQLHLREEVTASLETFSSKRHPAFEVANLSEVRTWLTGQGVAIEAASPIEGRQRFFFRDPFGNRLELLQFSSMPI